MDDESQYAISYEILVRKGQRWQIHARFHENQREPAVAETHALRDAVHIDEVRLIREKLDKAAGRFHPELILKYETEAGERRRQEMMGDLDDYDWGEGDKNPLDFEEFFSRVVGGALKTILVFGASLFAATAMGAVMWAILGAFLAKKTAMVVSGGVAVLVFIALLKLLHRIQVQTEKVKKPKRKRKKKKRKPKEDKGPEPPEPPEPETTVTVDDSEATRRRFNESVMQGIFLENKRYLPIIQLHPPSEPAPKGDKKQRAKQDATQFIGRALGNLKGKTREMDQHAQYGASLFLAGACETLGYAKSLKEGESQDLVRDALHLMGVTGPQAQAFAKKYGDYLMENPRYAKMFDSGARAMYAFLGKAADATGALERALDAWSRPDEEVPEGAPLTVMFTFIDIPAELAGMLGDDGLRELRRAHGSIVREHLEAQHGAEVKHTGTGIMATFRSPTRAVRAARDMQWDMRAHSIAYPRLPLRVGIGLHAGQAIAEEGDFYGIMVSTAARFGQTAEPGQVLVSELVRDAVANQGFQFNDAGLHDFKGVDGLTQAFELSWRGQEGDTPVEDKTEPAPAEQEPEPQPQPEEAQPEIAMPEPELPTPPEPAQPQQEQPPEPPTVPPSEQPQETQPQGAWEPVADWLKDESDANGGQSENKP